MKNKVFCSKRNRQKFSFLDDTFIAGKLRCWHFQFDMKKTCGWSWMQLFSVPFWFVLLVILSNCSVSSNRFFFLCYLVAELSYIFGASLFCQWIKLPRVIMFGGQFFETKRYTQMFFHFSISSCCLSAQLTKVI